MRSNIYEPNEATAAASENVLKGHRSSSTGEFVHVPVKWNFILLVKEVDPETGMENTFTYE